MGCKSGLIAAAALVGMGASAVAQAQTASSQPWMGGRIDYGFYVGANVGYSKADVGDPELPAPFTYSSTNRDESDTGAKVFAGYRFTRHLALEAGYTRLGKFSHSGTATPGGGTSFVEVKMDGWNVDLVGILPLQNNFSIFGRIGAFFSESRLTASATAPLVVTRTNAKERETNLKVGAGVQYDFTPAFGLRAEWERYANVGKSTTSGELDVDLFSLGLLYRFR